MREPWPASDLDADDEDLDDETGELDPEWYPLGLIAPGLAAEYDVGTEQDGGTVEHFYSPDQARDEGGRFASGGGGGASAPETATAPPAETVATPERQIFPMASPRAVTDPGEQAVLKPKIDAVMDVTRQLGIPDDSVMLERGPPKEFDVGGQKWHRAGYADLQAGYVTFNDRELAIMSPEAAKGIAAHEVAHQMFEHALGAVASATSSADLPKDQQDAIFHRNGHMREEAVAAHPEYVIRYGTADMHLSDDDGVSDYSRAYWKDYKENKVSYTLALHETTAEIMRRRVAKDPSVKRESKGWKRYVDAVEELWKRKTGAQRKYRRAIK